MTGAAHHRGSSKQDYATPWPLIHAIESRWGKITVDLAASAENAKAPTWFDEARDSFTVAWHEFDGLLFLNPPFANIAPWAAKCAAEWRLGARIAFLVPAAVGSRWFLDHVHGKAMVCPLLPRVSFDGKNPYPKDCMVCVYGEHLAGFAPWDWRAELERAERQTAE